MEKLAIIFDPSNKLYYTMATVYPAKNRTFELANSNNKKYIIIPSKKFVKARIILKKSGYFLTILWLI